MGAEQLRPRDDFLYKVSSGWQSNKHFIYKMKVSAKLEELKKVQSVDLLADGFAPDSFKPMVTLGVASLAEKNIDGVSYVQSDVKATAGFSGGPLLDSTHKVLGIITMAGSNDTSGYNLALLANQLQDEISPYMSGD